MASPFYRSEVNQLIHVLSSSEPDGSDDSSKSSAPPLSAPPFPSSRSGDLPRPVHARAGPAPELAADAALSSEASGGGIGGPCVSIKQNKCVARWDACQKTANPQETYEERSDSSCSSQGSSTDITAAVTYP